MTPVTKLNPDKEHVALIREGIKQKNGYCPCKLHATPENKCPCVEYRQTGDCCCGLFIKVEPHN